MSSQLYFLEQPTFHVGAINKVSLVPVARWPDLRNCPDQLAEKSSPEDREPCAVFRLFFSSGEALANKLAADFDSGEITT